MQSTLFDVTCCLQERFVDLRIDIFRPDLGMRIRTYCPSCKTYKWGYGK